MQIKLEETQSKEQSTLAKLQECIQMVEQGQFEKNEVLLFIAHLNEKTNEFSLQAIVERDQTRVELAETQKRLKKFLDEMNEKIQMERANAEKICEEKLKENAEKVRSSTAMIKNIFFLISHIEQIRQAEEKSAQYELTVDRLAREKTSLAADLDEWKTRIHRQEVDLSQVRTVFPLTFPPCSLSLQASDSVKLQIQKATRERDQANANTMQIRTDFEKLLLQSNQVRLALDETLKDHFDRLGYSSTSSSTWFDTKSFS